MGAEAFTILAVLEARDRASEIFARVSGSMDRFESAMGRAAVTAEEAGAAIDTSLLQTASGADAFQLASARMNAAQVKSAAAAKEQAAAERDLMAAQAAAVSAADGDTAAQDRLAAAAAALTKAEKASAKAADEASAAQGRMAAMGQSVVARADAEVAADDRVAAARARVAAASDATAGRTAAMSGAMKTGALVVAAAAAVSVKAAGDFESSTQHLVTDAGESQKNLKMIQKGILDISSSTGTSAKSLSDAMYHIESAGYHGSAGLKVLRTSAEGAKVGGADFETVAKTLTGTMNSYGMSGDQAVAMMNQLITTTASGDMRMQDLASSLGNVAPLAAAAGLSFSQVGGALATMTAQNMSAQQGTQNLANTIRALSNPNNVAIKEMQAMGLNSNDLSKNLGKRGLTGTLEMLTRAVAAHTKGGDVLVSTFNSSKQAASNANTMIKAMPASLQAVAKGYLNGSTTLGAWRKELKTLPPVQAAMMSQFATLANRTHSFNDMLKNGSPAAQTYNAAMAKLLGGATGLNTSLMITGGRMEEFKGSTERIAEAAKHGGSTVEDWDKIQKTFNQKLDHAKYSIEAAGISIGMVLLPAAEHLMDVITGILGPITEFVTKHQRLVGLVLAVAGGMLLAAGAIKAVALATKLWVAAQEFLNAAMAVFDAEEALTGIPELIILIAALVAGLIYAWNHFETFREVVTTALHAVAVAGEAVWTALVVTWDALVIAAEATWHALETAWDATAEAGKAVWSALVVAWDAIVTAANATWHALEAAWNAVAGAAKAVWSAITDTWHAIWNTTMTIWNRISGFFKKWWPLLLVIAFPFIAALVAAWNHFHTDVFNVARSVWGAIAGFFKAVWSGIETVAGVAWTGIKVAIIGPVMDTWHGLEAVWNAIVVSLKAAWGVIKTAAVATWAAIRVAIIEPVMATWHTLQDVWKTITGWLATAWGAIRGVASSTWSSIRSAMTGPITSAWHTITSVVGKIKDAIQNGLNNAWNTVKGIGSKFEQIGKAIIDGIVRGIEHSSGAIASAAKSAANGALKSAKSFLGIGSPSRVFADEVGKWIPAGVAQGVTQYAHVANKAVGGLAAGLPGATRGASLAPAMVGSGGGGTNITFDFRGSQVMSDRDMDILVSKVGRAVATKILPQGGVRVRM